MGLRQIYIPKSLSIVAILLMSANIAFASPAKAGTTAVQVCSADSKSETSYAVASCLLNSCFKLATISSQRLVSARQITRAQARAVFQTALLPELKIAATEPVTPVMNEVSHGVHSMSAYTSETAQTDNSPCVTANGFNVCEHGLEDTVAANFLPMGAKVKIPELFGDRIFIVRDRMNSRFSERIDVWMRERSDAMQFGVRSARLVVLK